MPAEWITEREPCTPPFRRRISIQRFQRLNEIAVIEPEVVFSTYSENLTPADWQVLSQKVLELAKSKTPDGIVIMMGTDTLAYSSAALSFLFSAFRCPLFSSGPKDPLIGLHRMLP